ncbi:hypothetical protein F5B20DRAFT_58244 [Whalleya microplaca]|nr:hypothetical protein F5B20DRAFT_58244 [Whalleya microplaca]
MQFKQLITAFAVMCGASMTLAQEHGEFADHNGLVIRYHQLARGVWTGVPADEWDDEIHQRSDEVWELGHLATRSSYELVAELEGRNLKGQCQAVFGCAKEYTRATVSAGYWLWLAAAEKAADNGGRSLMKFLDRPFWANAGGVAIAGTISGQINKAASSCSTSSSEADVVGSAVAAAVAAHPNASELSVTVKGTNGAWTVTLAAGPAGKAPNATCN